jgi:hypothetical protein
MRNRRTSGRGHLRAVLRSAVEIVVAGGLALALAMPVQAQFWSPFSYGPPRRPAAPIPQQQPQPYYNPFGGFFGPPQPEHREAPVDYSHAPAPQPRKSDIAVTTSIVVMGDAMADWLASGLEDAYSEQPEIGVLRRHRTTSGLIRYDPRRDVDWAQTARDIIGADKPSLIVMMIGSNDHQAIRERAPTPPATPARGPNSAPGKPAADKPSAPAAQPVAAPTEDVPNPPGADSEQPPIASEPGKAGASATGPFEFHTDQWEAAYIRRIDATIAALKSANVPVLWVGLPAQRNARATSDASYLNELYRSRAEKAGIVFVDIWDGFVDEQGRYSPQGPDFEGQTRRLRSGDGVYFTKFGARKLAHYVEREIGRLMANRSVLVSLPSSTEPNNPGARPGGPSARPSAGPVIPLTAAVISNGSEELMGGAKPAARPTAPDPLATRVLTKGEAIGAPAGRADDFSWPRGSVATVKADPEPPAAASAKSGTPPATAAKPGTVAAASTPPRSDSDAQSGEPRPKRPAPPPASRPPAAFGPFSIFR